MTIKDIEITKAFTRITELIEDIYLDGYEEGYAVAYGCRTEAKQHHDCYSEDQKELLEILSSLQSILS